MERHGKATKTCTFGTKSHAQRMNAVEWGRVGKHVEKMERNLQLVDFYTCNM